MLSRAAAERRSGEGQIRWPPPQQPALSAGCTLRLAIRAHQNQLHGRLRGDTSIRRHESAVPGHPRPPLGQHPALHLHRIAVDQRAPVLNGQINDGQLQPPGR